MIEQAAGTVMTASPQDLCDCPKFGLGPLLQDKDSEVRLIKAGWKCKVRIETLRLTDEQRREVDDAWRAALFFGGVGARTRRGFGSLFCAKMHTEDEWHKLLAAFERTPPATLGTAAWPSLGGSTLWTRPITETDAVAGWRHLIDRMGEFRQGLGIGRSPVSGGRPGRSYWPEPDAVRTWLPFSSPEHPVRHPAATGSGWFPRAAYGLPLSIRFKQNGNIDPAGTALITPPDRERWPSPVILKTIRFQSGLVWQVCLWLNHQTPDLSIRWSPERNFGFPAGKGPASLPRTAGPDNYAGKVIRDKPGPPTPGVHPVKALADHLHLTLVP
jgi:CRISPR-associated protein Cmr1